MDRKVVTVALSGNPNSGKTTIFNQLTGTRQKVGNWPGVTVEKKEGRIHYAGCQIKIVDLPGTYSLLSTSTDEEVARNFILFGQPDVTIIVVDSTRLERNLNLVIQILEITNKAVICLNMIDEAQKKGIEIDIEKLSQRLGIPVEFDQDCIAQTHVGQSKAKQRGHCLAGRCVGNDVFADGQPGGNIFRGYDGNR